MTMAEPAKSPDEYTPDASESDNRYAVELRDSSTAAVVAPSASPSEHRLPKI